MAVLYDIREQPYYLILHRVLRWHGWELLKGTIEDNESSLDAIKREIKEETGLNNFEIKGKIDKKLEWVWGDYRVVINEVYIVKASLYDKISLKQKIKEHDEYRWIVREDALKLLTHDNSKKVLELVHRKLFK